MKSLSLKQSILITIVVFILPLSAKSENEKEVVVAIIDTGVDVNHPYLKENLWRNPKEKNNAQDNDGNGYVADIHGWNFASNNNDVTDNHGHGTHVAGIILKQSHSKKVRFMILKYYDPEKPASSNLLSSVKALHYAIENKADIINYSGGGESRSPMEEAAIRSARENGILVVAAAGNDGRNTDRLGYYPAGYRLSNIISVAAMGSDKKLLQNSNYGEESVDIVAPGKDVYSTLPGGKFGLMSGTSMATAWVSGLAAFLMTNSHLQPRPEEIKKVLEKFAVKDQRLYKKVKSQSRISSLQLASNFRFSE